MWTESTVRLLIALLVLWAALLVIPARACAQFSPMGVTMECLDRHAPTDAADLPLWGVAPLESWERIALDSICRGCLSRADGIGLSKNLADRIGYSGDAGILHLSVGMQQALGWRDAWGRGDRLTAVLYSDASMAIQVQTWRALIARSIAYVRERGWSTDVELATAAAVANSSPSALRRHGATCRWDAECVADRYASESAHRARRVRWLRSLLAGYGR